MVDMADFSGSMDIAQEQVLLVVCSTQVSSLHVHQLSDRLKACPPVHMPILTNCFVEQTLAPLLQANGQHPARPHQI